MDLSHLKELWGRANWIVYFIFMTLALIIVYNFVSQLDMVYSARSDLSAEPFAAAGGAGVRRNTGNAKQGWFAWIKSVHGSVIAWVREKLEMWTAAKNDKTLAWTLGIGWACCGGGLAGGCLVFAKAWYVLVFFGRTHR